LDKPIYKKEFILNLIDIENVKLWLLKFDNHIISGMIVFYADNEAFYWHGATLVSKEYKKLFAVVKLMNYVIKDLHAKNIKYLNMGASEGLDGVKKFKESFGAKEFEYNIYEFKSLRYKIIEFVRKILP